MTLSAGYCCPGTHWRPLRRRVLGAHECPTWLGTPERKLDWFTGNFTSETPISMDWFVGEILTGNHEPSNWSGFPVIFPIIQFYDHINGKKQSGWWYTYPSEKYEFVTWDDEIPNWMESHKIPWFRTTNQMGKKHGCRFRFSLQSNERKKTWVSRQNWGIFGIENVAERWRIDLQVIWFFLWRRLQSQKMPGLKMGNCPYFPDAPCMVYANIWGKLMVNVTIYSIHGSYGFIKLLF